MSFRSEYFKTTIGMDFFDLIAGKKIGNGVARQVFLHRQMPDHVIKIEVASQSFQNTMEWEVWNAVQFTDLSKWFAPCVDISPCGIVLIQKRAEGIPAHLLPKKVPSFMVDLKQENWGVIKKKPVCFDYGYTNLINRGITNHMRLAQWS